MRDNEALRRELAKKQEQSSSEESDSDESREELIAKAKASLGECVDAEEPGSALLNMKFMVKAREAQRARAREDAEKLLEELEADRSGSDDDDDEDGAALRELAALSGDVVPPTRTLGAVIDTMRVHARRLVAHHGGDAGETFAMRDFRKHTSWYLSGYPVGPEVRRRLSMVSSLGELDDVLDSFRFDSIFRDLDGLLGEDDKSRAPQHHQTTLPAQRQQPQPRAQQSEKEQPRQRASPSVAMTTLSPEGRTSAFSTSFRTVSTPSACLRSTATLRRPRASTSAGGAGCRAFTSSRTGMLEIRSVASTCCSPPPARSPTVTPVMREPS